MFEKSFLEATAERAVKTFIQTILALVGTNAAGVLSIDILAAAQVALSAALLSVLTSFGSSKVGNEGPSLAGETTLKSVAEKAIPVLAAQLTKVVEDSIVKQTAAVKKPAPKKSTAKKSTPKK
jgi:Na+/proline symporter